MQPTHLRVRLHRARRRLHAELEASAGGTDHTPRVMTPRSGAQEASHR